MGLQLPRRGSVEIYGGKELLIRFGFYHFTDREGLGKIFLASEVEVLLFRLAGLRVSGSIMAKLKGLIRMSPLVREERVGAGGAVLLQVFSSSVPLIFFRRAFVPS
jgi:hypothetical protein